MAQRHLEEDCTNGEGKLEQDVERENEKAQPREKGKEQASQEEVRLAGPGG
jgi:hypothetical protein